MMPRALRELFRPECSECGNPSIVWGRLDHVAFQLHDLDARKRACELMAFLGNRADAWICPDCQGFGAFI